MIRQRLEAHLQIRQMSQLGRSLFYPSSIINKGSYLTDLKYLVKCTLGLISLRIRFGPTIVHLLWKLREIRRSGDATTTKYLETRHPTSNNICSAASLQNFTPQHKAVNVRSQRSLCQWVSLPSRQSQSHSCSTIDQSSRLRTFMAVFWGCLVTTSTVCSVFILLCRLRFLLSASHVGYFNSLLGIVPIICLAILVENQQNRPL